VIVEVEEVRRLKRFAAIERGSERFSGVVSLLILIKDC